MSNYHDLHIGDDEESMALRFFLLSTRIKHSDIRPMKHSPLEGMFIPTLLALHTNHVPIDFGMLNKPGFY